MTTVSHTVERVPDPLPRRDQCLQRSPSPSPPRPHGLDRPTPSHKDPPPPVHYSCNAPVLLQGGSFDCDFCTERPTFYAPHRGAAIADGAELWPDSEVLDDLLVGGTSGVWLKPFDETWQQHTGTVALFSGSTAGAPSGVSSTSCRDDDDAALRIVSEQFGDLFGFAVCTIGDLEDDGYDEFLVGAPRGPFAFPGQVAPWEGRVYLFLSSDFQNWGTFDWVGGNGSCKLECQSCSGPNPWQCDYPGHYSAVTRASAILEPPALDVSGAGAQYFGFALENLGDLDGDGLDEVGIGAPHKDNRTTNPALAAESPGRCYIISGLKRYGPAPALSRWASSDAYQTSSSPVVGSCLRSQSIPSGSRALGSTSR